MLTNQWRKSTRSGPDGNCVEARIVDGSIIETRDSKDKDGPVHRFTLAEWYAFIDGVKAGEFDLPRLEARRKAEDNVERTMRGYLERINA